MIADEEFPSFLYPNGDRIADHQFDALDPTLFSHAQTTPPQAPFPPATMTPEKLASIFAVGGDQVNSTPFSAMVNILILREHNRIARQLEIQNPGWDDARLFQTARNILIPVFMKIAVEDYINHITPMPFSLHAVGGLDRQLEPAQLHRRRVQPALSRAFPDARHHRLDGRTHSTG